MAFEHPKGYVCYWTTEPITIDGHLEKPVWQDVPWTDDFVDIEGDAKPRPRFRTRAKMRWDLDYFYLAAEMEEPHVWATLTEHDSVIFQDNDFEIFIDPDGDNHNYYEIEINALNTEWDLRLVKPYRDGGPALNAWEIPGLKTAVHIAGTLNDPTDTDQGWTVEFAIPWNVLGEFANCPSPPNDGDQWRVNFSRVEWEIEIVEGKYQKIAGKPEDNWVWSPQGVIDMHRPEKWGYVQFSTAPVASTEFRPDPAHAVRATLHALYEAQSAFHKAHDRWATSLEELPCTTREHPALTLLLTPEGYQATCTTLFSNGTSQHWHIRQDSRIWCEDL